MTEDKPDGLFEIRLNTEGVNSIQRFAKTAKWVFGLMLVSVFVELAAVVLYLGPMKPAYLTGNSLAANVDRLFPYYSIVYIGLAVVETWYYLKTAKQLSGSLADHDTLTFNKAFGSLLRSSIFAVIVLSLGFILTTARLYVYIDSYYKYQH